MRLTPVLMALCCLAGCLESKSKQGSTDAAHMPASPVLQVILIPAHGDCDMYDYGQVATILVASYILDV